MAEGDRTLSISISAADLAELEDWARNEERAVEALVADAIGAYLLDGRRWMAEIAEADNGPFHEHNDMLAELARRRQARSEAAE